MNEKKWKYNEDNHDIEMIEDPEIRFGIHDTKTGAYVSCSPEKGKTIVSILNGEFADSKVTDEEIIKAKNEANKLFKYEDTKRHFDHGFVKGAKWMQSKALQSKEDTKPKQ